MNNNLPTIELLERLKSNTDFVVAENVEQTIYSLIVIYKGNVICSRGTFKRANCYKYLNKRLKYVADLENELKKLNIILN